mmetsp:Transcript_58418/g.132272  ORF Transcript_58418/g.132272 Transcript_58418/m.132272 type:complete len:130 (+) Transcript_58418:296-685(+)
MTLQRLAFSLAMSVGVLACSSQPDSAGSQAAVGAGRNASLTRQRQHRLERLQQREQRDDLKQRELRRRNGSATPQFVAAARAASLASFRDAAAPTDSGEGLHPGSSPMPLSESFEACTVSARAAGSMYF